MTYRELLEQLSKLSEEQLDDDAIVFFTDECEFIGLDRVSKGKEGDPYEDSFYLISN